jgi:hypothetical protein
MLPQAASEVADPLANFREAVLVSLRIRSFASARADRRPGSGGALRPDTWPQSGPSGPQRPAHVSASGAAPAGVDSSGNTISYDPQNIADGRPDTAWRVPGDGVGQHIQIDLAGPVRVSEVQLIPAPPRSTRATAATASSRTGG